MRFMLVFLGSGLGGAVRYGVGVLSLALLGPGFPYGTLAINVLGSAAMGGLVALLPTPAFSGPDFRLFVTTGLIGGFTTFSTFSLDTVVLIERGEAGYAGLYVGLSVAASIAALFLAMHLTRHAI